MCQYQNIKKSVFCRCDVAMLGTVSSHSTMLFDRSYVLRASYKTSTALETKPKWQDPRIVIGKSQRQIILLFSFSICTADFSAIKGDKIRNTVSTLKSCLLTISASQSNRHVATGARAAATPSSCLAPRPVP